MHLLYQGIQNAYLISMLDKFLGNVTANEAAASRNQYAFHDGSFQVLAFGNGFGAPNCRAKGLFPWSFKVPFAGTRLDADSGGGTFVFRRC
jgi:hypothetical protein